MMQIETRKLDDQTCAVVISGRIMLGAESLRVEEEIAELIRQGTRRIICDLSGVTHIDSTGIGRFISSLNLAMKAGATLLMAGATGAVRQAFHITLLDTVFKFYPTLDEARAALH